MLAGNAPSPPGVMETPNKIPVDTKEEYVSLLGLDNEKETS